MEKRQVGPLEVSRVARGTLEVLVALGSASVVLLAPLTDPPVDAPGTQRSDSTSHGISRIADAFHSFSGDGASSDGVSDDGVSDGGVSDGGVVGWNATSNEQYEVIDVSGWFGELIALGLLLGADAAAPAPAIPGAVTPDGGVVLGALQLRGDADAVSVTVLRLGEGAGSESLSVTQALTLASAALTEILDPAEAQAFPELPLGS
jgi:hypothetical protein